MWPPIPIHELKLRPNHTLLEDIPNGFCSMGSLYGFERESFTSHGFAKNILFVINSLGAVLEVLLGIIFGALLEAILEILFGTLGLFGAVFK